MTTPAPTVSWWKQPRPAEAPDRLAEALFTVYLAEIGFAAHELEAMVAIGVFVVEGLLMHPGEDSRKRAVIETLLHSARGIAMATIPIRFDDCARYPCRSSAGRASIRTGTGRHRRSSD